MDQTLYIVWVSTAEKIVSFHEITGSERIVLTSHEHFTRYVDELIAHGFRFQ